MEQAKIRKIAGVRKSERERERNILEIGVKHAVGFSRRTGGDTVKIGLPDPLHCITRVDEDWVRRIGHRVSDWANDNLNGGCVGDLRNENDQESQQAAEARSAI